MKSELLCICFLSLLLEISECGLPPARQRGPLPGCTFDCPPDAHHGQACGPGCVCLQDMYNLLAFACVHRSSVVPHNVRLPPPPPRRRRRPLRGK
uniref:Secreted protein n=1 Tax=Rhipicephalus appendiculatus TaxID=34631 RepID=A0A131YC28_RHIAP